MSPGEPNPGVVSVVYGPIDYTDEHGTSWRIEIDGSRVGNDEAGNTWFFDTDGGVTSYAVDGRVAIRHADGSWSVSDPLGNEVAKDRDGVLHYRDAQGHDWTWSPRDEAWQPFDQAVDGSHWQWDAAAKDFVERETPHPTRPEIDWTAPGGAVSVREVYGNLFLTQGQDHYVRYGSQIAAEHPELGGWRHVTPQQYAQNLANSEQMEEIRHAPQRWDQVEYASGVMDLTKILIERSADTGLFLSQFAGPWGKAFYTVMDTLRTADAVHHASSDQERLQILVEALTPGPPSMSEAHHLADVDPHLGQGEHGGAAVIGALSVNLS